MTATQRQIIIEVLKALKGIERLLQGLLKVGVVFMCLSASISAEAEELLMIRQRGIIAGSEMTLSANEKDFMECLKHDGKYERTVMDFPSIQRYGVVYFVCDERDKPDYTYLSIKTE